MLTLDVRVPLLRRWRLLLPGLLLLKCREAESAMLAAPASDAQPNKLSTIEMNIAESRAGLQRRIFDEFERRERKRKIAEITEQCPDVDEDGAKAALEACGEDEVAATARLQSFGVGFLRMVRRKELDGSVSPAAGGSVSPAAGGSVSPTAAETKSGRATPITDGDVFVGAFKKGGHYPRTKKPSPKQAPPAVPAAAAAPDGDADRQPSPSSSSPPQSIAGNGDSAKKEKAPVRRVSKPGVGRVRRKAVKNCELVKKGTLVRRKLWHNKGYIFTDGFESRTTYRSSVELGQLCWHTCTISSKGEYSKEGGPTFTVVAADRPDEPLTGKSCTMCWSKVLKRIRSTIEERRAKGESLGKAPGTAIAGPEYFGLSCDRIMGELEKLDKEKDICPAYWEGRAAVAEYLAARPEERAAAEKSASKSRGGGGGKRRARRMADSSDEDEGEWSSSDDEKEAPWETTDESDAEDDDANGSDSDEDLKRALRASKKKAAHQPYRPPDPSRKRRRPQRGSGGAVFA